MLRELVLLMGLWLPQTNAWLSVAARGRSSVVNTGSTLVGMAKPLPWEQQQQQEESTSLASSLALRLSKATLAKLAVAFSPPERRILLSNIDMVQLLAIDDDHVEIEAVVCDDDGCVSLFIPIDFSHSCRGLYGDSEEECILDNMDELQHVAEGTIRQLDDLVQNEHWEQQHPEWTLDTRRPTPQEVHDFLPTWWIAPERADVPTSTSKSALIEECELIRRLLNSGDFDQEIKELAQDGLIFLQDGDLYQIEKAVVADVGPAGLCLRARAFLKEDDQDQLVDEHKHRSIVELCFPFGGEPALDSAVLRSKVLGAVASVST